MTPRSLSHPGSTSDLQLRGLAFQGTWLIKALMVNLESFGDGNGWLHTFVRKKSEKRGRSWKAAAHMDFTLDSSERSALEDALFPLMQVNQLSNYFPACRGCSREPWHKKGDGWQTRRDTGDSRGAELLYEARTVDRISGSSHTSGSCRRSLTYWNTLGKRGQKTPSEHLPFPNPGSPHGIHFK